MEIFLNGEKFTRHECKYAEHIFESCVAEVVREHQNLCQQGLEDYIVNSFVDTWLDLFGTEDCSIEEELFAKKRAYAAFNYANQSLGALGSVRMLVDSFNVDPPPNAFMDRLEKALDQKIVLLRLQPMSLPAKETAFTM